MFAYYAKWINEVFNKIRPLIESKKFPVEVSNQLKKKLREAALQTVDKSLPFEIESIFLWFSTKADVQ